MNIILVILLTINLALFAYYVNLGRKREATVAVDVNSLKNEISQVSEKLNGRIDGVVKVSNTNTQAVMSRFKSNENEIDDIISKMESYAHGIAQVDKDVKEIRRYYCNYVSKTGGDAEE